VDVFSLLDIGRRGHDASDGQDQQHIRLKRDHCRFSVMATNGVTGTGKLGGLRLSCTTRRQRVKR